MFTNSKNYYSIVGGFLALLLASCSEKEVSSVPSGAKAESEAEAAVVVEHKKLDYNRDVQPILSNYCYHCHGPDTATRKPKSDPLRLDLRDEALAYTNSKGVKTIVPGKPDESELIRRIESHDPELMMPQDKTKLLNKDQIALLRRWIEEGAEFRDHWAFEAPVKSQVPENSDEKWAKNAVDSFVLTKLAKKGLEPNEEATRPRLIRRVTLDLTGLLPTPEEVKAFVEDEADSDTAYAKVVDRLLASTAYGEQRARYWLDYSRYGDTHGIHVDAYRQIWPFRDYLIRSFNDDKRFDRFTKELIAGDLLPDGDLDSQVATGFIRAGLVSGEGGTIPQELWVNNKRERTEAFGAVFMGITTGCAVCHDHKYDPLSARDLYALSAYFGNVDEKPYHNDKDNWAPIQVIPHDADLPAYNALLAKKSAAQAELSKLTLGVDAEVVKWLTSADGPKPVAQKSLVTHLPMVDSNAHEIEDVITGKSYKFEGAPALIDEYPLLEGSFRMDNNTRFQLKDVGDFEKDEPFTVSAWMRWNEEPLGQGSKKGTILSRMDGKAMRGWEIQLLKGNVSVLLSDTAETNALQVTSTQKIQRTKWVHLAVSYDGSAKAAGVRLYINGEPAPLETKLDKLTGTIKTAMPFNLGRRAGEDANAFPLRATGLQDIRIFNRSLAADEITKLPWFDPLSRVLAKKKTYPGSGKLAWSPFEVSAARNIYLEKNAKALALRQSIDQLDEKLLVLTDKVEVSHYRGANKPEPESKKLSEDLVKMYQGSLGSGTMVCKEKSTPAFAHVLDRGDYGARKERVYASTPSFLPEPPAGAPANRLGLAQWLVMKENPLTARVTVNRVWQELFGRGLVETAGDFGIVGSRPSHPKLLDYLAIDFRDGDKAGEEWQWKRLYRKLVMSMTYRQSARVSEKAQNEDRLNIYYSHAPRYRMDAEMLRDAALQSAGLLNRDKLGGPPFYGYQPVGIWSNAYPSNTKIYNQHKAPIIYRRSMYQFVKRTAVHPELSIFDATDRLMACVRRDRTNTPLAALALLNDVTFLEAARVLGATAIQQGTDVNQRLDFMAQRVWGRNMEAAELESFIERLKEIKTKIAADDASKLLVLGEFKQPADLDPVESAAWMSLASILLNSDEFLNK